MLCVWFMPNLFIARRMIWSRFIPNKANFALFSSYRSDRRLSIYMNIYTYVFFFIFFFLSCKATTGTYTLRGLWHFKPLKTNYTPIPDSVARPCFGLTSRREQAFRYCLKVYIDGTRLFVSRYVCDERSCRLPYFQIVQRTCQKFIGKRKLSDVHV